MQSVKFEKDGLGSLDSLVYAAERKARRWNIAKEMLRKCEGTSEERKAAETVLFITFMSTARRIVASQLQELFISFSLTYSLRHTDSFILPGLDLK